MRHPKGSKLRVRAYQIAIVLFQKTNSWKKKKNSNYLCKNPDYPKQTEAKIKDTGGQKGQRMN